MVATLAILDQLSRILPGDTLTSSVRHGSSVHSTTWFITIRCNRQCFPSPFVRGGLSTDWFVGTARSQAGGEKTAAKILRRVNKLRGK